MATAFLRRLFAPNTEAVDRLRATFSDIEGPQPAISIWAKGSGAEAFVLRDDDAPERAAARALALSDEGVEAYFGACLRNAHMISPQHRGGNAAAIGLAGLWVDLDHAAPYRKAKKDGQQVVLPPDLDAILRLLSSLPLPPPTLLVNTGAGLHAWWLLKNRPWPLVTVSDRKTAKVAATRLQALVRDAAASFGWHVDGTSDLARELRVPGTYNHKGEAPKLVKLLDYEGADVLWEDLNVGAPPVASSAVQVWVEENDRVAEISSVPRAPLLSGETLLQRVKQRMLKTRDPDKLAAIKRLVEGQPFLTGERDTTLQRLTATASWIALEAKPDLDDEDLWPLFEPSVRAMEASDEDDGNPPPSEDRVRDMITRNIADATRQRPREWAIQDATKAALARAAMKVGGSPDFRAAVAERTDEELDQGYTQADLDAFAKDQNCTPEEFRKRLVIQFGGACWIWSNGRYLPSVPPADVEGAVEQWLAPVPWVDFTYENEKGEIKRRKFSEVLRDCRTVALEVEADLTLERSVFDAKTFTFREAVCPLRELDPLFVPEIDMWLRLVGGDLQEQLLDWVASVPRLDRQCCALYLCADPGVGKTLLASGLARLYTTGGATELDRVLANFNASLATCPLVFGDEELPQFFQGGSASAKIRKLIGSSDLTLNRKHKPEAKIVGAIRLILAANNDQLLQDPTRDYSKADLQALAERILFIDVTTEAREYLEKLGGPPATEAWVKGDLLARHALWLFRNRPVVSTHRFLVKGTLTRMHRLIVTGHGEASRVTDWIAHLLDNPNPAQRALGGVTSKEILIGNGHVLVTTRAVLLAWTTYVKYGRLPTTTSIGRALANISIGGARVRNLAGLESRTLYHDINLKFVLDWAERAQFGDLELMGERVLAVDPTWQDVVTRVKRQQEKES